MENQDLKILCIDDEPAILELYEVAVRKAGFTPISVADPAAAVAMFGAEMASIVLVLCDFQMPKMNGFECRRAMLPKGLAVPFVIVSSYVTKDMALEALDLKIAAFFDKPISTAQIAAIIAKESTPRVQFLRECQALEGTFVDEATVILDEIEPLLLSLDHDRSNPEAINAIFRGAHTLKGSSGCLESDVVTKYVHRYEDIISGLKKGQLSLTDEIYEVLFRGFDRIKALVAAVPAKTLHTIIIEDILPEVTLRAPAAGVDRPSASGVKPTAKAEAARPKGKDSISVPVQMLDELSGYSGEITVIRNMVNKIVRALEGRYPGNKDVQSLGELLDEMHKINGTIQVRITDLRKVPIAGVLKPIPRIIRDLSRDLAKNIMLTIEGESLRVDNALAVVCSNSLIHLIRNSADHGIESPQERVAAGKPAVGTVLIRCVEEHDEVHITIRDDGRGIDHRKIRAKALEKGLYTEPQLAAMSEQQALGIIFASGFSTAAQVSDVSGRGVGMDMVKSSVDGVGGDIDIESKPGSGSTLTLRLPIPKSVLIINSLLIESAGHCFAVPQDSILRVLRVEPAQYHAMFQTVATGSVLRDEDKIYPLVDLKTALGLGASVEGAAVPRTAATVVEILIVKSDELLYALRVDGILDSEEIVVKRLPPCFNPRNVYAGATFMGDGTIGLILDVGGLAAFAGVRPAGSDRAAPPAAHLEAAEAPLRDYLLFNLGSKTLYGAPLGQVFRLEEIDGKRVQRCGAERVVIYRDRAMPIYSVERLLNLTPDAGVAGPATPPRDRISLIVAEGRDGFVGLEVSSVIDIASTADEVSGNIRDRLGVTGNTFIRDHTVTILDLPTVLQYSGCGMSA